MSQRRFLPAFGTTSVILAVSVLVFGWGAGQMARVLREQFPGGNASYYWSVGGMILMPALALLAVFFGIAALFGYGKVNGKSHRLLAVLGILLGGFLGFVWGSAIIVGPIVSRHVAERGHNSLIVHRDHGFELLLPGEDWQILQGEGLQALSPSAVAAVVRSFQTDEETVGMVLVEPLTKEALDNIELGRLAEAVYENLATDEKELLFLNNTVFEGNYAVEFQAILQANGQSVRWQELLIRSEDNLLRAVAFGARNKTEADGSTFKPFYDAFSLVSTGGEVGVDR